MHKDFDADNVCSIGLPPAGEYHIDVDPSRLAFMNQGVKGTLVSPLNDIDEALDFAKWGQHHPFHLNLDIARANSIHWCLGKLHLEPTVVGLSKWDESVQKLRAGQVAGSVLSYLLRNFVCALD